MQEDSRNSEPLDIDLSNAPKRSRQCPPPRRPKAASSVQIGNLNQEATHSAHLCTQTPRRRRWDRRCFARYCCIFRPSRSRNIRPRTYLTHPNTLKGMEEPVDVAVTAAPFKVVAALVIIAWPMLSAEASTSASLQMAAQCCKRWYESEFLVLVAQRRHIRRDSIHLGKLQRSKVRRVAVHAGSLQDWLVHVIGRLFELRVVANGCTVPQELVCIRARPHHWARPSKGPSPPCKTPERRSSVSRSTSRSYPNKCTRRRRRSRQSAKNLYTHPLRGQGPGGQRPRNRHCSSRP